MIQSSDKMRLDGIEELEHFFDFYYNNNHIIISVLHKDFPCAECCRCKKCFCDYNNYNFNNDQTIYCSANHINNCLNKNENLQRITCNNPCNNSCKNVCRKRKKACNNCYENYSVFPNINTDYFCNNNCKNKRNFCRKNAMVYIEDIINKTLICKRIKINYLAEVITDLPESYYKIWCESDNLISEAMYISIPCKDNKLNIYI